jgi:hypothetical protein
MNRGQTATAYEEPGAVVQASKGREINNPMIRGAYQARMVVSVEAGGQIHAL